MVKWYQNNAYKWTRDTLRNKGTLQRTENIPKKVRGCASKKISLFATAETPQEVWHPEKGGEC